MDASLFFTTKKGNSYIFDINKKDLVLCHPHFKKIAELASEGFDFSHLKIFIQTHFSIFGFKNCL